MTVYGISTFKALPDLGVSLEEYVKFHRTWSSVAAERLGLKYSQELQGEWIVFTVSGMK